MIYMISNIINKLRKIMMLMYKIRKHTSVMIINYFKTMKRRKIIKVINKMQKINNMSQKQLLKII